jgi:hypothetical protein
VDGYLQLNEELNGDDALDPINILMAREEPEEETLEEILADYFASQPTTH